MFGCTTKLTQASWTISQLAEKEADKGEIKPWGFDAALSLRLICGGKKNDLQPPWTHWSWISIKVKLSAAPTGLGRGTKLELTVRIRWFNSHMEVWVSQSYDTLGFLTEDWESQRRATVSSSPVRRRCNGDGSLIVFQGWVCTCVQKYIMLSCDWESVIQFSYVLPWPM